MSKTSDALIFRCRLCDGPLTDQIRASTIPNPLSPEQLKITDSTYGMTGNLYRCGRCGLVQCPDLTNVLDLYEKVVDPDYELSRDGRALQSKIILDIVKRHVPAGKLLDVGAGSGILVEQACKSGFFAEGIEPSSWLVEKAVERGLPVFRGTLPSPMLHPPYDIVTLIDVIEHVTHPLDLLIKCRALLSENGILVMVTPDKESWCARLMGWKWWHYRIAHISYFDIRTVSLLLEKTGFSLSRLYRTGWYFPLNYLTKRLTYYLPIMNVIDRSTQDSTMVVPLNLFDSMTVISKRTKAHAP